MIDPRTNSAPAPPAARTTWAIEADAVSFAYADGIEALSDVTFRAAPGELVAVTGPNGAGKTTLMKILLRLLRPRKGRVRLGGTDIAGLRPAELYRRVAMVLQNPADQLFATTVEQDVAFGPRNLGLAEAELADRVAEALAAVDALALRDRPIQRLSYGEQKRVCLAGVLAMRPDVLVMDEPTAGLDPAGESAMIELLLELNRRRKTTLIVSTHSVDLLPVAAHRICVLSKGRIEREGTPREIFADPEALARAGLRLPLVAQVFHGLRDRQGLPLDALPLGVAEARQAIIKLGMKDSP
ncbi:MAG: ATP-binding cassette domain-containing protein [Thermoguttaceae bacterium]|jgi:cobalt/nickel transport system ATP-binding protein